MPNCYIDWAATGAMIGGIGTWVAGIGAIVVAILLYRQNKQVANKQFEQTEYQQKIALYDKRYDVYTCFIKYFGIVSFIDLESHDKKDISAVYTVIADFIFNNSSNMKRHSDLQKVENSFLMDSSKTALQTCIDTDILEATMQLEDFNLQHQIKDTIALSEFCFSKEISTVLNNFIKKLFDFITLYKFLDPSNRNNLAVKKTLEELANSKKNIQDENIVQKMKDELNLAYNDTLPQKKKRE